METPTARPVSAGGVTRDLISAGDKYDQERSRIEKYFYADVHGISKITTNTDPSNRAEILQRKQSIAHRYESVEEFEKHIDVRPAVAFWVFSVVLASSIGILLNVRNGNALWACIGLGVLSVTLQSVIASKAP